MGSLQSSELLLPPHLCKTHQVTCPGGCREPLLLQGCLGNPRSGPQPCQQQQQQPRFEPRLENPLQITTHLQAQSAVEQGGSLRARWEEREHPKAPGSSQTFQLQAQSLHQSMLWICRVCMEQYRTRRAWVRAGLGCCFVVLSITVSFRIVP